VAGERDAQAPATSPRRAGGFPALGIAPCWRRAPAEYSAGITPQNFMRALGVSKRVRSPRCATGVTATVPGTPRRACRASTSGDKTPRLHGLLPCLCATLAACGVCGHGTDIGLQDDVGRWCLTQDCRAPLERGGAPGGPARVAAIVSEEAGGETERGGLAIAEGLCTGAAAGAHRVVCPRGDRDCGALA
jgi:hypothetical protein